VCLFDEVLGQVGGVAVHLKGIFVFIKSHCKTLSSLPHIRLIAVGARQFVYPRLCVFISCLLSLH